MDPLVVVVVQFDFQLDLRVEVHRVGIADIVDTASHSDTSTHLGENVKERCFESMDNDIGDCGCGSDWDCNCDCSSTAAVAAVDAVGAVDGVDAAGVVAAVVVVVVIVVDDAVDYTDTDTDVPLLVCNVEIGADVGADVGADAEADVGAALELEGAAEIEAALGVDGEDDAKVDYTDFEDESAFVVDDADADTENGSDVAFDSAGETDSDGESAVETNTVADQGAVDAQDYGDCCSES